MTANVFVHGSGEGIVADGPPSSPADGAGTGDPGAGTGDPGAQGGDPGAQGGDPGAQGGSAAPSGSAFKVVGPESAPDDVLRVEHIAKRFGPVTALRDVNLHLRKGEVLGLLGDNGAGKSTLIKIICGFQKQDSGKMWLHGQPYEPKSVDDARSRGIETVYQDLALVDELSVYHNLFLRRERVHRPIPLLSNRQMKREARGRAGSDRDQHPPHRRAPWRACREASDRRSPWPVWSTPTRTSSSWTSPSRRWAPKRGRRSSTSWPG